MKYYNYLDLNWKPVAEKLNQYIETKPALLEFSSSWKNLDAKDVLVNIPELQEMFNPLGITVKYLALFITNYKVGTIHVDADNQSKCRINFPVLNCELTETRFYVNNGPSIRVQQPNGVPLLRLLPSQCTLVDQFYLERGAVVFRNTEPHQVVSNNPMQPRISCTVGFHEDIEYLLNI